MTLASGGGVSPTSSSSYKTVRAPQASVGAFFRQGQAASRKRTTKKVALPGRSRRWRGVHRAVGDEARRGLEAAVNTVEEVEQGNTLEELVRGIVRKNASSLLATAVALTISTGSVAPLSDYALADALRDDISVVKSSTIQLSEEINGAASIVKDCRTDAPGLQSVYWISSRSVGQNPTLYAVDKDGKMIGEEYQVQTSNVGQEEIVFVHRTRKNKPEDFIVLADTSNKFKNRDQLKFYEIIPDVPNTASSSSVANQQGKKQRRVIDVRRQISFEFPRAATPPPSSDSPSASQSYKIPVGPAPPITIQYPQEDYETAAIIVNDDTLYVFSKRSVGSSTALYRLPLATLSPYARSDDSKPYILEFIQEFSSGAPACGADISTDGTRLAVMTRETIFLFDLTKASAKENPLASLITRIPVPKIQNGSPVGITWDDPKNMLVLSDTNQITRITLSS